MKTLYCVILALAIGICSGQSQIEKDQQSRADLFSLQSGTLIKKVFIDIGSINKAEIQVVHYTDLISSESISAVKFEYKVTSSYSSDTKSASLDSDEIDELIKSLIIIRDSIFPSSPTTYEEIRYRSRGGFEAGCYWSKSDWSAYLKLEKYDSKSYVFLQKEDFPELLNLLKKAQASL